MSYLRINNRRVKSGLEARYQPDSKSEVSDEEFQAHLRDRPTLKEFKEKIVKKIKSVRRQQE